MKMCYYKTVPFFSPAIILLLARYITNKLTPATLDANTPLFSCLPASLLANEAPKRAHHHWLCPRPLLSQNSLPAPHERPCY